MKDTTNASRTGLEIAIIGMSGRFPGASNVHEYWQNLLLGKESITHFSKDELAPNVSADLHARKNYVSAKGYLKDIEYFDAEFFGYHKKEAIQLSPQSRVFQECVWECFEDAGYNLQKYQGSVGVYAGASSSLVWQLLTNFETASHADIFNAALLNDKDYLSTRASYQLGLKGPSITINTACSTSLVAVHLACRALLTRECDTAIAGGVSVSLPIKAGYLYEDGMINSPDGHCRPFDKDANGTVFSDGAGVVLLKTLSHAIRDKDNIHAIILGSAVNNDGRSKVGFTAPSTLGQADVIRRAYHVSKTPHESISYVETHGTGTQIGDPIEIEAIKSVFKNNKSVVLGSVKGNFGHLDVAAGVASLIKVVLALKNRTIPQTLHFNELNRKIDLKNTCFSINKLPLDWRSEHPVLRAGINSFGIGGTNVHVVVEQAASVDQDGTTTSQEKDNLLLLSAKTENSLLNYVSQMKKYVTENEVEVADVVFTQNFGRAWFDVRAVIHFSDKKDLAGKITAWLDKKVSTRVTAKQKVVFAFGGIGSEYPTMGIDIFNELDLFRQTVEEIGNDPTLKNNQLDVCDLLYGYHGNVGWFEDNKEIILFTFEYALGRFLIRLGVEPFFMIGHGVGEYVAAAMSGVLSLSDAYKILFARKEINAQFVAPVLLSANNSLNELAPHLKDGIFVAACNSSTSTVVAGTSDLIDQLKEDLLRLGIRSTRIPNTQIFNTGLSRDALSEWEDLFRTIKVNVPTIPYISTITGKHVTSETVIKEDYWFELMTQTIRFELSVNELLKYENTTFVELGPSMVISSWINRSTRKLPSQYAASVIKNKHERASDISRLNECLGELWKRGVAVKFDKLEHFAERRKISLPTYQFDRKYVWVDRETIDLHSKVESESKPARLEKGFLTRKEIEEQLLYIWSEVIGDTSIDPRKNLFEMGITSLDAINVHRKLKNQIDIPVEVTAMFEHPTIESFATHLLNLKEN